MKTVDHDKVDLPLGAGILSANGIAMDGIMDLDYFQVSPRIKVRVGKFIKISGGPRYENKLMGGMRGVWLVRKIYEDKEYCKVLLNYTELMKPKFIKDETIHAVD